jgi:rod shape-determining protein MreD
LKTARFALSTLAAVLATVTFHSSGIPLLPRIDWFLIAVAYQATAGEFTAATLGGAAGGLVQDILLHPLRGASAFAKALLGYMLTLVSVRVVFAGALAVAVTLTVAAAANDLTVAILGRLLLRTPLIFGGSDLGGELLTGAAGGMLYAAWRFPWREELRKRSRRRLH